MSRLDGLAMVDDLDKVDGRMDVTCKGGSGCAGECLRNLKDGKTMSFSSKLS